MKIAIVGGGISGLAAARALAGRHDVALFEREARPGGHVYTVDVDGVGVDMGFIVCNRERYPLFFAMLDELGVTTRSTTMSFSVSLPDDGLEWGSASLAAMFADRRRLLDRRHWRFLVEVVGFLRRARRDLAGAPLAELTLDDYLASRRVHADVRERFAIPLAAALWSLAPERCGEFPAETYLRFLDHHGMLRALRPFAWHTIRGGSGRYVDALVARLRARGAAIRCATPVDAIVRDRAGVTVVAGGREHRFDRIVVATHADAALALLDRPTDAEREILGAFRYSQNRTVLHRDRRFLPHRAAAHAAWNYIADADSTRVAVTYSMTRLQGLSAATIDEPYLVTLNPRREPAAPLHAVTFAHPQLDRRALVAQRSLATLGAADRTHYAGAYAGFGFHEDGMRAGIAAARRAAAD